MQKTPDEIKKGLECCISDTYGCNEKCPYFNSLSNGVDCAVKMHADALALIQRLQDENAQLNRCIENMTDKLNAMNDEAAKLQAERDAAVADVALFPDCCTCKYDPRKKGYIPNDCDDCIEHCNYKWRGVTKEE